ncbi:MAG TPA: hypothetical protein VGB82_27710 [Alphaproteobacteria bacterium]
MRAFLLVAALCIFAAPAVAQKSRDAPGRITPDRATSSCIGSAGTPVCAAETLLACLARADESLCRRVGAAPPGRPVGNAGRIQVEYVLVRVSVIRPEDITDDTRDLEFYKPGYMLVEMDRRACPAEEPSCSGDDWDDLQVYLKRGIENGAAIWDVVAWRSESEPDLAPDIPDAFQHPAIESRPEPPQGP